MKKMTRRNLVRLLYNLFEEEIRYEESKRSMNKTLFDSSPHPVSKRIKEEKGKNIKSFVKDEAFKGYMKYHTINSEKNENDVDMVFDICKTQLGTIS